MESTVKKNIITDYLPIWGAIIVVIIAMLIGQMISSFWLRIFTGLFMWIGLAISWNIVGGYTGYVNFGHGAFFGIGAYVAGLIILGDHMPFSIAMVIAAFICRYCRFNYWFSYDEVKGSLLCNRNLVIFRRSPTTSLGFGHYRGCLWYDLTPLA